jgi:Zn-dependent M28 family amino/carboxypeptidase
MNGMDALAAALRGHVERLASVPRPPGSPAHQSARHYISGHLQAAGFGVFERHNAAVGFDCVDVMTDPFPGRADLPLFVVGAHYDSIAASPGADDNASAVAALLELAGWLQARLAAPDAPLRARLQLVAYDLEEFGMVGSWSHAARLKQDGTRVRGMISLEMLGFCRHEPGSQRLPPALAGQYPDTGDFIGVIGNTSSAELVDLTAGAMKTVAGLPVESIAVPGVGHLLPETRLSDHSSVWEHGFPALMITDTSFYRNPHYHQPTDTPDSLDYAFLARVTEGVCRAVWRALTTAPA